MLNFDHVHDVSVGSLGKYRHEEDVRGIVVKNCTLSGTDNGVRIKTWPGSDSSSASGMLFQDIIMNNVKNPIIIDQRYCDRSSKCTKEVGFIRHISSVQISPFFYIYISCSIWYLINKYECAAIACKDQQRLLRKH